MRLEARVLEGDQRRQALVPLCAILDFKREHGFSVNDAIGSDDVPFEDWEPWLAWRTMVAAHGESRDFDDWCDRVDWVGIYNAPNVLDPSGGEATPTQPSSPASSPERPARGRSSLPSTTTSRPPSGQRSRGRDRPQPAQSDKVTPVTGHDSPFPEGTPVVSPASQVFGNLTARVKPT